MTKSVDLSLSGIVVLQPHDAKDISGLGSLIPPFQSMDFSVIFHGLWEVKHFLFTKW